MIGHDFCPHGVKDNECAVCRPRSPIDLDAMERLAKEATPGPWYEDGAVEGDGFVVMADLRVALCKDYGRLPANDNATFIATANPTAILELVAELREARAYGQWEEVRDALYTMACSSEVYTDENAVVTGYKIKTGALHHLLAELAVPIPANLPLAHPTARVTDGMVERACGELYEAWATHGTDKDREPFRRRMRAALTAALAGRE